MASIGRRFIKLIVGALALVTLAIAGLYIYFPIKGLVIRTFFMPSVVSSAFITELDPATSAEQKRRFVEAWQSGVSAGLHHSVGTVEGDPLNLWAITHQGCLLLVTDYTRDSYSKRGVSVEHPATVELWQSRDSNPLRAWFPDDDRPHLRFVMPDGSDAFF